MGTSAENRKKSELLNNAYCFQLLDSFREQTNFKHLKFYKWESLLVLLVDTLGGVYYTLFMPGPQVTVFCDISAIFHNTGSSLYHD